MPDRTEPYVGLEVLLAHAHRGADEARAVADRLRGIGFDVTGVGESSLTLRLSRSEFRRLFHREPAPPADATDFAAWAEPDELPVPDSLAPWVESLSEARTPQRY